MHSDAIRESAQRLFDAGLTDTQASLELGLPRSTVRDWRRLPPRTDRERCPRCWRAARPIRFDAAAYCELLGLYLGDGCISRMGRSYRLRIALDTAYPGIIKDTTELLAGMFPTNRVGLVRIAGENCANVSLYSLHLPCMLPQHGPGKKHHRSMSLEPWQVELVEAAPWGLIRGLIRSDGCVFINRTGRYEYLSYCFDNLSEEISTLFTNTASSVGLTPRMHRRTDGRWQVRIYRRDSVALLVKNVGLKI